MIEEVNNKLHLFGSKNIPKHFQPRNSEILKDKVLILLQLTSVMVYEMAKRRRTLHESIKLISLINPIKGPFGLEVVVTISGYDTTYVSY